MGGNPGEFPNGNGTVFSAVKAISNGQVACTLKSVTYLTIVKSFVTNLRALLPDAGMTTYNTEASCCRDLPQFGHKHWQTHFGKTFDVYTRVSKELLLFYPLLT